MSLLDMFKKKSDEVVVTPGTSLDNLPPVPQNPDSSVDELSTSSSNVGLPPAPIADSQSPSTENESLESSSPVAKDIVPAAESQNDVVESGLEVPFLDELNSIPDLDDSSKQTTNTKSDSAVDVAQELSADEPQQEVVDSVTESKPVDSIQEDAEEDLPNFDELNEEISQERVGEQLAFDDGSSADIKTESLLLKSIFVEREHYANILFSLKRVKDDLKKSAPQQRKLSHVDMKLGKEYSKLSTSYENFNENLMIIEHILSNEQF